MSVCLTTAVDRGVIEAVLLRPNCDSGNYSEHFCPYLNGHGSLYLKIRPRYLSPTARALLSKSFITVLVIHISSLLLFLPQTCVNQTPQALFLGRRLAGSLEAAESCLQVKHALTLQYAFWTKSRALGTLQGDAGPILSCHLHPDPGSCTEIHPGTLRTSLTLALKPLLGALLYFPRQECNRYLTQTPVSLSMDPGMQTGTQWVCRDRGRHVRGVR